MADGALESGGALKRKLDEGETQTTKDQDLSSPPAKVRVTDDKTRESGPTKPNTVDVPQSAGPSNQTTADVSDDEREKMQ